MATSQHGAPHTTAIPPLTLCSRGNGPHQPEVTVQPGADAGAEDRGAARLGPKRGASLAKGEGGDTGTQSMGWHPALAPGRASVSLWGKLLSPRSRHPWSPGGSSRSARCGLGSGRATGLRILGTRERDARGQQRGETPPPPNPAGGLTGVNASLERAKPGTEMATHPHGAWWYRGWLWCSWCWGVPRGTCRRHLGGRCPRGPPPAACGDVAA